MADAKITSKILVDKEKNRVLFAEADKDFVDILFSFLTLPMGTIIRLLGKQSNLGCMDRLYESVENLDTKYLQTKACKTMLLRPISAAEYPCEKLTIKVDDTKPRRGFMCQNYYSSLNCRWLSTVQNTRCQCGQVMHKEITMREPWLDKNCTGLDRNGVFVKGSVTFMISDDLQVMPACTKAGIFMFDKFGVNNSTLFEEQLVDFGRDEILKLLKCSLLSNTPLTDVFLRNSELNHVVKLEVKDEIQSHMEKEATGDELQKIRLKLFLSKSGKEVLYGEAGQDFVDLLFSLLVLPVGSAVKYLGVNSSLGSIDNLYKSVEDLKVFECMDSKDCESVLLSPKLAPYFGCDNQFIQIVELQPYDKDLYLCCHCYTRVNWILNHAYVECSCGKKNGSNLHLKWMNPKSPNPVTKTGGGYMMGASKFLVTDEMVVTPLSFMSIINNVHQLQKPISDLKEKEVCLGEAEVLALLKATLITRTALSSVFSQKRDLPVKVEGRFS